MGMFDVVAVECPVEGIENPAACEWQTKSFDDPFLHNYRITADGRLLSERVRYEDRSDPNAPSDSIEHWAGMCTPVHEGWDEVPYHGDVWMIGDFPGAANRFVEIVARFTEGRLTKIDVWNAPAPRAATEAER